MTFPIKCHDCGNAFNALKVTASLKCARCGSDDIDLDDRTASSPGTGWNHTRPDRLEGWNDYAGPLPGSNPLAGQNNVGDNTTTCQACGGTGVNQRASGGGYNEIPCRNCHGTGVQATHASDPGSTNDGTSSGPPVGGARYSASASVPFRWTTTNTAPNNITYTVTNSGSGGGYLIGDSNLVGYTSGRRSTHPMGSADDYIRGTDPDYDNRSGSPRKADTRSPDVKYRQNHPYNHTSKPLPLSGAKCPSCGNSNTQLVRDSKNDAWWHCQNCGSLANVDRNPDVNPFAPSSDFEPDRSFGQKKRVARFRRTKEEPKTGKALKMVHATIQTNPGLTVGQALTLVRNALSKYPEN